MDRDRNRYPSGGDRDRFPLGDRGRYPADRDRYIPLADRDRDRDRYPLAPYDDRYPDRLPPRYPYDDIMPPKDRYADRYPEGSFQDRYPYEGRYPPRDRYPIYRPTSSRYPPVKDNSLPGDLPHTRPYNPDDDMPSYRPYMPDRRYPDERYPSRYPPVREPLGGSTGRDAPEGFPDRRFRPSSYDSRYPLISDGSRGPVSSSRYGPDGRYPPEEIIHSARRPEPDSAKRYPAAPLPPPLVETSNKYPPTSPNRFPIGSDRYPIDIYKYGNRYGGSSQSGVRPGKALLKPLIN